MTAIWKEEQPGDWSLLRPSGFTDEKTLHDLIEQAPQLLPIAGGQSLVIVGREVNLGSLSADLIAIEPEGRLVIIEIKLRANSESRRAIIAQVLAYAARFHRMSIEALDATLAPYLKVNGHGGLAELVETGAPGIFDRQAFNDTLQGRLNDGSFRLVLVLDEAPEELVRLVGYLEAVAPSLLIDLITVSAYDVGSQRVVVPQRVTPEPEPYDPTPHRQRRNAEDVVYTDDSGPFEIACAEAPPETREIVGPLVAWSKSLETDGLARLRSSQGKSQTVLSPKLLDDDVGLASIYLHQIRPFYLQSTVLARRSPIAFADLERRLPAGKTAAQAIPLELLTQEFLQVVRQAYVEAKAGKLITGPQVSPTP